MPIFPDHNLNAFDDTMDEPIVSRRGRPRQIELTAAQKQELASLYLATNSTKKSGSMTIAWDLFTKAHPELGWTRRASKHSLPAVALEVMRQARPLVGFHRGGEKKLRESSYRPGLLRRNSDGTPLRAGQRASWDDATINFGVVVPWPWRGDKCADKYGVRLGRFQLLVCHDDATGFIPTWSYVIRFEQSYRGEDVASAMVRTSRDIGCFDSYVLEGGVWKSHRVQEVLDTLGIHRIDAQGRPQCKLVEKFFGKLWTIISALAKGHVGRFQAEDKATSDLYVACRNGRKDPRKFFLSLTEALDILTRAIDYCNHDQWESREYGKWIPAEVWERDTAAHPLRAIPENTEWLMAPVIVKRKVTRATLKATVLGSLGVSQRFSFSAPWLVQYEGRELTIHFDPLAEYPLKAMVSDPRTHKFLGTVDCSNPVPLGGVDEDIAKQIRQIMRTEYKNMTGKGPAIRESTLRAVGTATTITQTAPEPKSTDTLAIAANADSQQVATPPPTPARSDDFATIRRKAGRATVTNVILPW